MRAAFLGHVRRFPWATNVTLYGCLFAAGDLVHQRFSRTDELDWRRTMNVALVAFSFHGNFNFWWMRFLEAKFPGRSAGMLARKLILDQTAAAPLATTMASRKGVSFLEGKDDIMEDWRKKFLNTYKLLNFALVPLYLRTTFTGCCGFVWATFLCFSLQSGDGTAGAALVWLFPFKGDNAEALNENADTEDKVVTPKDGMVAFKSTQN
uniref:Uncharacterized protein n=1 Tax=Anabas testudineus TaxID=64144 RepID=A0A7N6A9E1_ANATE